ncbi:MAG: hypothetical protein JO128_08110 [Alphaproteobacteria bacterium]|nr:hypothetical protein [Alphaproteobacteria bacterium]
MSGIPASAQPGADVAAETAARAKALDDAKLQQIVSLLEAALERPDGVTAKTMLDQLRPKLIEARPHRRPNLRRSLCEPFEDMLVNGVTSGHLVGRIPRSAIMPVWDLFIERGDSKIIGPAQANPLDKSATNAALDHFVAVMKVELAEASAFATKGRSLLLRLGGETHYLALEVMVGAVSIARQIAHLKAKLPPKPIREFGDEHLNVLADTLNEILKKSSERIATALFVVMARMAEPWKIANVLETLAMTGRFKSSAGINEFSSAALVGRLETQVQAVEALADKPLAAPAAGDKAPDKGASGLMAASLARDAGEAVQSLAGTREALEKAGSKAQLREVERARQKLREVVDAKIVAGAAGAIVGAVSRQSAPLSSPPDAAAWRNAELRAVALKRSNAYAELLTLHGDVAENLKRATEGVEKAASELFTHIRRGRLQGAAREAARQHVMSNARLMEILSGPEKAEQLLMRGLEALGEKF